MPTPSGDLGHGDERRDAVNAPLVIFDCDGVLVDSERLEVGTIAEALTWVGADLDADALHDHHRGRVLADLFALVEQHIGERLPDWFPTRYRQLQLARLAEVGLVPGADQVVQHVVVNGWRRCVVSGGPAAKMEVSLNACGLWEYFVPHLYSCYDIADHKPSPGIYRHALSVLGVSAEDCVAIEDSVVGVTAAAAAGVPVIGLARDTQPSALLKAGAVTTVSAMADVIAVLGPLGSG